MARLPALPAAAIAALLLFAFALPAQAQREYRIVERADIPGNDIPSNGQPFTKVCANDGGYKGKYGYDAYKLACDDTQGCVAAVANAVSDGCAYLKSKGSRDVVKADPKFVVVTSAEKPAKISYSQNGGFCNANGADLFPDELFYCAGNHVKCVDSKCASDFPTAAAPAAPAAPTGPRDFRVVSGHEIPGNDIPSNGQPFTKVCIPTEGYKGKYGYNAYMVHCDETPGCMAAVAPMKPDGCAYLKSKGTRDVIKPDNKWVIMTAAEKPPKMNFSPLGGYCGPSDLWAAEIWVCGGNKNPCVNNKCESGYPSGRKMI
ncbi:hypothetical protein Rsub_05777 [Raphidocelis subcapitata]|uniref:Uncharacterized protein n=1 Tax=Raphidocelis subcapitata TaxID=307507 RepID=A0A2V0NZ77_9CHLO|nr:hypothetical protein Rsub_05777 [Raphidocelis subcapitata]|eukprot:GBF92941.1 hypothetical protein Rsub_05777 [Raphidocelis subcapitata]